MMSVFFVASRSTFAQTFYGNFEIVNVNSGLALEVLDGSTSAVAEVDQNTYIGHAQQQWTLYSLGNSNYEILNAISGLALEVYYAATTNYFPYHFYRVQQKYSSQKVGVIP